MSSRPVLVELDLFANASKAMHRDAKSRRVRSELENKGLDAAYARGAEDCTEAMIDACRSVQRDIASGKLINPAELAMAEGMALATTILRAFTTLRDLAWLGFKGLAIERADRDYERQRASLEVKLEAIRAGKPVPAPEEV